MITIKKPEIKVSNGKARLSAVIQIDGGFFELWYQVDEKYASGLCDDRGDAFVCGLLYFAMRYKHDIYSEAPLTWELKDGIENNFLDVVCENLPGEKPYHVIIKSPICNPILKNKSVCATGISCGVDSLHAVKKRLVDSDAKQVGDRYLVLNDVHGWVKDDTADMHDYRWSRLKNQAMCFAEECKIPLIIGETNYNQDAIPGLSFEFCTSFGNLFCILAMQNLYTVYYLASGGPLENLRDAINGGALSVDPDDIDELTLSSVTTRSLKIVPDGFTGRANKIRYLKDWPLAQKYLDVCHVHTVGNNKNGTYDCPKCMHTVVELMSVGALHDFREVFDVDYVMSHKEEYLAELIRRRLLGVQTAKEVWPFRKGMGFDTIDYIKAFPIVLRKIIKKVLRRGRVSKTFSPRG